MSQDLTDPTPHLAYIFVSSFLFHSFYLYPSVIIARRALNKVVGIWENDLDVIRKEREKIKKNMISEYKESQVAINPRRVPNSYPYVPPNRRYRSGHRIGLHFRQD